MAAKKKPKAKKAPPVSKEVYERVLQMERDKQASTRLSQMGKYSGWSISQIVEKMLEIDDTLHSSIEGAQEMINESEEEVAKEILSGGFNDAAEDIISNAKKVEEELTLLAHVLQQRCERAQDTFTEKVDEFRE